MSSLLFLRSSPTRPFISKLAANKVLRFPYVFKSLAAFFAPMPLTPGTLSDLSPTKA